MTAIIIILLLIGLPLVFAIIIYNKFIRRHRALHREAVEGGFPAEVAGAAAAAAAAGSRKTIRSA